MQFEKSSDLDFANAQGVSRTNRMQANTRAMEEQWKSVLQQVVDSGSWQDPATGNPWVPADDLLGEVKTVIENMELDLQGEENLNTWIMGNHTQDIINCNNQLNTDLTTTVVPDLNKMINERGLHSTCRDQEDTAIENMETSCKAFADLKKCDFEQDWFAAYNEGETGISTLHAVVTAAVSCKGKIAKTKAKADDCDIAQTNFTTAWCTYKGSLDEACSDQTTCYNNAVSSYDQAKTSIEGLEKDQKVIFRMLGRIKCYLTLLFGKSGGTKTPTQADITNCEGTTIVDDILNVDYGSKAAKADCYNAASVKDEAVTDAYPGDTPGTSGTWYNTEFDGMGTHAKLNADSACD